MQRKIPQVFSDATLVYSRHSLFHGFIKNKIYHTTECIDPVKICTFNFFLMVSLLEMSLVKL